MPRSSSITPITKRRQSQEGTARDVLSGSPGREWKFDEIRAALEQRGIEVRVPSLRSYLSVAAKSGVIRKPKRGVYVWVGKKDDDGE